MQKSKNPHNFWVPQNGKLTNGLIYLNTNLKINCPSSHKESHKQWRCACSIFSIQPGCFHSVGDHWACISTWQSILQGLSAPWAKINSVITVLQPLLRRWNKWYLQSRRFASSGDPSVTSAMLSGASHLFSTQREAGGKKNLQHSLGSRRIQSHGDQKALYYYERVQICLHHYVFNLRIIFMEPQSANHIMSHDPLN